MKALSLLMFIAFSILSYGQDTLREQNSRMYSRYYLLFDNNSFEFHFNHCTGQSVSFGTYKKTNNGINFNYDSIPEPETKIVDSRTESDSIKIELFNISDSTRIDYFKVLTNPYKAIIYDGNCSLPTKSVKSNSIEITHFSDTIRIPISNNQTYFRVYIFPHYLSYNYFGVEKMKKKKDHFYFKSKVIDANEEKPWKKGKTRILQYEYKIENAT